MLKKDMRFLQKDMNFYFQKDLVVVIFFRKTCNFHFQKDLVVVIFFRKTCNFFSERLVIFFRKTCNFFSERLVIFSRKTLNFLQTISLQKLLGCLTIIFFFSDCFFWVLRSHLFSVERLGFRKTSFLTERHEKQGYWHNVQQERQYFDYHLTKGSSWIIKERNIWGNSAIVL
jgi:hypothetical protein